MAKRKKLKYMSKAELTEFANQCPGVTLKEGMTRAQIMNVIPWEYRDHDGAEQKQEEPKEKSLEEREAELAAKEEELAEREEALKAREEPPEEPIPEHADIRQVVKIKNNKLAYQLRKFVSMDGTLRYGLTNEQIEQARDLIKEIGCSSPLERPKKPLPNL